MSLSTPRPLTALAPTVLAFAVTALHSSCAIGPRLTNLNDPSCGAAVREGIQSLLTHYESPEVSAALADRTFFELQRSSPTPARFAVGGTPSAHTFDFLIEARADACVLVLQSATLSTIASSSHPQDATISTSQNRGSAFERVLPICACGP